jgi:AcrR family transcriptional regulator
MRQKTKELIFEGALRSFAEKGYNETTMEQIAIACGVAKGTLYYNFKTKEELYIFVIESGIERFMNMIKDYIESSDHNYFRQRIIRLIEAHMEFFQKETAFCQLLLSKVWGVEERQFTIRHVLQRYFQLLENEVDLAKEKGLIPQSIDSQVAASSFFGTVGFTAMRSIILGRSLDEPTLRFTIQTLVLQSLGIYEE